ncbi:MAG: branched-chain amino acid ABC transporter permease [Microbacterium sp.]
MSGALQQIVDGLATGSIYAALALAIVIVHRASGIVNFAQGTMGTLGAYLAWTLWGAGAPAGLAVAAAVVISLPFGAVTERLIIRRLAGRHPLTLIVVTVGLLIALTGVISLIWGHGSTPFPSLFPEGVLRVAGVAITYESLGNLLVLVVVVVLIQLVFLKTRFGLLMRSVADNRASSALLGMPTSGLLMAGWGIATAFATLAACLIAPRVFLSPTMMDTVLIYALTAAILGGLNSPIGAVVAALAIGVVENLAATYIGFIGTDLAILVPLVLMAAVLVFRPQGLFGTRELVRV